MVRGIVILLSLPLLLLAVEALFAQLIVEPTSNAYVVRRYGPIVILHGGGASLMLFDENFFNYSYRNVYVYIIERCCFGSGIRFDELFNDIDRYFTFNPYRAVYIVGVDDRHMANHVDELMGRSMVLAVRSYGDTVLIVVKSVRALDEAVKLLALGGEISSTYRKRVEIVSASPFEGFFTGRYNGTAIAYEAAEAVGEIGLGSAIVGIGRWIPALRIYAVLSLDKDELDRIAKNNNTDIDTVIKRIIDVIRTRVPEDIPLSIIVEKRPLIVYPAGTENKTASSRPSMLPAEPFAGAAIPAVGLGFSAACIGLAVDLLRRGKPK